MSTHCIREIIWITLNGGPAGWAGWRAVLPNEKHEFSAAACCTEGWICRLHCRTGLWAAH